MALTARRALHLAPWALFAVLCGCGPEGQTAAGAEPDAVLADDAEIVDSVSTEHVEVLDDRLVFPRTPQSEKMLSFDPKGKDRFLVGRNAHAASSKNPYGFLRKMRAVSVDDESGAVVVETDPASLSDVVRDGAAELTGGKADLQVERALAPGLVPQGNGFSGVVGLTAITLAEQGKPTGTGVSLVPSVTVTDGAFSFDPSFDVGMRWKSGELREVHALAKGVLNVTLKLKIDVKGKLTQPVAEKKELAVKILETPPVTLPPIFVGPVPVVTSVRLSLSALCALELEGDGTVEVGGAFKGAITLGAKYAGAAWQPVSSFDEQVTPFEPSFAFSKARLDAKCALKPRFDLLFYDLAGPGLELSTPYVEAGIAYVPGADEPWQWDLTAGVQADLKGSVKVLGKTFGDVGVNITKVPLWKRQGTL